LGPSTLELIQSTFQLVENLSKADADDVLHLQWPTLGKISSYRSEIVVSPPMGYSRGHSREGYYCNVCAMHYNLTQVGNGNHGDSMHA
jgi:hypothetical protein